MTGTLGFRRQKDHKCLLSVSVNKTVLKARFDDNINAEEAKMYICSN